MAPVKRLAALPVAFLAYAAGWWGAHLDGTAGATLPYVGVLAYYGVFWGGWLAIPALGIGATIAQPLVPERLRSPVRAGFVGWLLAWLGVLAALVWLGPPPGFRAVGP